MNAAQARELFARHGIKYVLAQFVDIHGAAKAKAVPAPRAAECARKSRRDCCLSVMRPPGAGAVRTRAP